MIWPGREVITYFGHMIVLSETPSVVEHRVGYDGIGIGDIQREAAADGALVSIAHPTVFPPATFGSFYWSTQFGTAGSMILLTTVGGLGGALLYGVFRPKPMATERVEGAERSPS